MEVNRFGHFPTCITLSKELRAVYARLMKSPIHHRAADEEMAFCRRTPGATHKRALGTAPGYTTNRVCIRSPKLLEKTYVIQASAVPLERAGVQRALATVATRSPTESLRVLTGPQ